MNLAILFSLSLIELCNVTDIPVMIGLLSLSRKRWHALLFPITVFLSYSAIMCMMYLDIDELFRKYWVELTSYTLLLAQIALVGAVVLIAATFFYLIIIFRKFRNSTFEDIQAAIPFKSVHPLIIIAYSIAATIILTPTYVPCITVMSMLAANGTAFNVAVFYIVGFCALSQVINVLIYIAFIRFSGDRFDRCVSAIRSVRLVILVVFIPIAALFIAGRCLIYCIPVLLQ